MATSQQPLGIMQLLPLDAAIVSQKTTHFEGNKYTVLAPDTSLVMHAVEENSGIASMLLAGTQRAFNMSFVDTQNNEVIRLHRPLTFGPSKMEVTVCGKLASVIRQKMTWMQPVLLVNNAADQPVLRVKGPKTGITTEQNFEVFANKTRIGVISKVWKGLGRELLSRFDDFQLSFPKELDVRHKCALIATSIFIDFLYYEK